MMGQVTDYREIRDEIDSFAILNCEHKRLFWRLIGHTAKIYKDPLTGSLWVYESTQMSYSGVSGVQIHPLGEWLAHYPGRVFLRHVKSKCPELDEVFWETAKSRFSQHIQRYRGTSYPKLDTRNGRWFLIKAAWDSDVLKNASTNPDIDSVMFCTMLATHVDRFCFLSSGFNPAEMEPDDTRPGGKYEQFLNPIVEISREIRIK